MSPESIPAYMRNEAIDDCLFGINNCPIPVIIECSNGEEFPVEKAYRVSGRASAIKILIGGEGKTNKLLDEIDDLKHDCKVFEDEKDNAESELEKVEKEFAEKEEQYEKEFERIQSALDTAQEKLGFGTAKRRIEDQIDDLFEKAADNIEVLKAEIERLTVDNTAMAWNIEQLTKYEIPTLN